MTCSKSILFLPVPFFIVILVCIPATFAYPIQSLSESSPLSQNASVSDQASVSKYLIEAEALIDNGHKDKAANLLKDIYGDVKGAGFANVNHFFELILKTDQKELFDEATLYYLMALREGLNNETDLETLKNEWRYFTVLFGENERNISGKNENIETQIQAMNEFWIRADPTPGEVANQRLVEHKKRIIGANKNFKDSDSESGIDSRGEIYIRYGTPDKRYNRPFNIERGEIYEFVTEFQIAQEEMSLIQSEDRTSNIQSSDDSGTTGQGTTGAATQANSFNIRDLVSSSNSAFENARRADDLMDAIYSNPFKSNVLIWIYNRFDDGMNDNLVFYFKEEKNGVYSRLKSLDDYIPRGLFSPNSRGADVNFSPALPLQYITYQRLKDLDRQFMDIYNDLQFEIFNPPAERSGARSLHLSSQIRANNQRTAQLKYASAPEEKSTEIEKVTNIPLEIYQYRTINRDNRSVFTTFIESKPLTALISDLMVNKNILPEEADTLAIGAEIFNWMRIEQGVELYDESMQAKGKIRGNPIPVFDDERKNPTRVIVDIPAKQEINYQIFYSKLENHHPGSKAAEESVYPDELRGLGRKVVEAPPHFHEHQEGIIVSDLIFGYNRQNEEGSRFPFTVSHNRILPENDNPVIHFEVYRLQRGEDGFSDFEVEYKLESKSGSRGLFRRRGQIHSGTLEFRANSNRFSESLEFDDLPLKKGIYTLTWTVRDLNSSHEFSRQIEFEVVDYNEYISSR